MMPISITCFDDTEVCSMATTLRDLTVQELPPALNATLTSTEFSTLCDKFFSNKDSSVPLCIAKSPPADVHGPHERVDISLKTSAAGFTKHAEAALGSKETYKGC